MVLLSTSAVGLAHEIRSRASRAYEFALTAARPVLAFGTEKEAACRAFTLVNSWLLSSCFCGDVLSLSLSLSFSLFIIASRWFSCNLFVLAHWKHVGWSSQWKLKHMPDTCHTCLAQVMQVHALRDLALILIELSHATWPFGMHYVIMWCLCWTLEWDFSKQAWQKIKPWNFLYFRLSWLQNSDFILLIGALEFVDEMFIFRYKRQTPWMSCKRPSSPVWSNLEAELAGPPFPFSSSTDVYPWPSELEGHTRVCWSSKCVDQLMGRIDTQESAESMSTVIAFVCWWRRPLLPVAKEHQPPQCLKVFSDYEDSLATGNGRSWHG